MEQPVSAAVESHFVCWVVYMRCCWERKAFFLQIQLEQPVVGLDLDQQFLLDHVRHKLSPLRVIAHISSSCRTGTQILAQDFFLDESLQDWFLTKVHKRLTRQNSTNLCINLWGNVQHKSVYTSHNKIQQIDAKICGEMPKTEVTQ